MVFLLIYQRLSDEEFDDRENNVNITESRTIPFHSTQLWPKGLATQKGAYIEACWAW